MQNKARIKMACNRDAFTRDYGEIRERLGRDGAMATKIDWELEGARARESYGYQDRLRLRERQERDRRETRERQDRDGAMADGLPLTNEIARPNID